MYERVGPCKCHDAAQEKRSLSVFVVVKWVASCLDVVIKIKKCVNDFCSSLFFHFYLILVGVLIQF